MNSGPSNGGHDASPLTLSHWVHAREPRLYVSAKSEPEPVLLGHNLIAVVHEPEASRELIRKWERIQPAAAGVGFVALSRTPRADGDPMPAVATPVRAEGDPQKVAGHTARRILRGAIPGGLLGAVVVGVIVAILAPDGGNVIGAALGGAAFGFIAGAVISFVAGTGWSEAYKESFVEPTTTELTYASIHSDDIELIRKAAATAGLPGGALICIDRSGRPSPFDETSNGH